MTEAPRPKYPPTEVLLEFGDGEYLFKLRCKQIAELQEKCGAGIEEIYSRVLSRKARLEDCLETVRLGLIGGGLDPIQAKRLTDRYAGDDAPQEYRGLLARAILGACVHGYEPASQRKKKARKSTVIPEAGSISAPPMPAAPSQDSPQPTSTN